MIKVAYFLRKTQTSQVNNLRILSIAKFSGYYFLMNSSIQWNFQICIGVHLRGVPVLLITLKQRVVLDCELKSES